MNGKQQAVMWMGLILIVLRLFTTSQWHDIWSVILQGTPSKAPTDVVPPLGPLLPLDIPPIPASAPRSSGNTGRSMNV